MEKGPTRRNHAHVIERGDFQCSHELRWQLRHIAADVPIQTPRVVLDVVNLVRAVRFALLALVSPGIRRLDTVSYIVPKRYRAAVFLDLPTQEARNGRLEIGRAHV